MTNSPTRATSRVQFGTDHYDLVLRPDVIRIVEELTWYLDEPFGDTSAIPTYMVSKLASEHVKVVLTGDGGDEVFAGYERYLVEDRERAYDALPRPLRKMAAAVGSVLPEGTRGKRFLQHFGLEGNKRYLDASMMFRADETCAACSGPTPLSSSHVTMPVRPQNVGCTLELTGSTRSSTST